MILHSVHYSLIQLDFYIFLQVVIYLNVEPCFKIFCNVFINIICFNVHNKTICIHIPQFCFFTIFQFYIIKPKLINILIFYSTFYLLLILKVLDRQVHSLQTDFCEKLCSMIIWFNIKQIILLTFCDNFNIFIFSHIFHTFSKNCIIDQVKKSFSNSFFVVLF